MSRVIIPPKIVSETRQVSVDFLGLMAAGETLSVPTVTCTVYSGTDASPSSVVSGSASVSGSILTQLLTGGTAGVIYELLFKVTGSVSTTLKIAGYLAVIEDLP